MSYQCRIRGGVDMVNYTWVDPYLKGLKYQEKVKALGYEIDSVLKFPCAKTEILEELEQMGERVKALRISQVRSILSQYQNGELPRLTPEAFAHVVILPNAASLSLSHTAAHDFESLLAADIIEESLKDLPTGMTVAGKKTKIAGLEGKIKDLERKIADECWPDSRKVFDDKAQAIPGEDRWQAVVEHWRKVAAPYSKPVDLAGFAIEQGKPAWEAFRKLGIRLIGTTTPRERSMS